MPLHLFWIWFVFVAAYLPILISVDVYVLLYVCLVARLYFVCLLVCEPVYL